MAEHGPRQQQSPNSGPRVQRDHRSADKGHVAMACCLSRRRLRASSDAARRAIKKYKDRFTTNHKRTRSVVACAQPRCNECACARRMAQCLRMALLWPRARPLSAYAASEPVARHQHRTVTLRGHRIGRCLGQRAAGVGAAAIVVSCQCRRWPVPIDTNYWYQFHWYQLHGTNWYRNRVLMDFDSLTHDETNQFTVVFWNHFCYAYHL